MTEKDLATLRYNTHKALIECLKEVYKKDKWKYTFIKNSSLKYGFSIQYNQLRNFEAGQSRNENIINIMILELISYGKQVSITYSQSAVKVTL